MVDMLIPTPDNSTEGPPIPEGIQHGPFLPVELIPVEEFDDSKNREHDEARKVATMSSIAGDPALYQLHMLVEKARTDEDKHKLLSPEGFRENSKRLEQAIEDRHQEIIKARTPAGYIAKAREERIAGLKRRRNRERNEQDAKNTT